MHEATDKRKVEWNWEKGRNIKWTRNLEGKLEETRLEWLYAEGCSKEENLKIVIFLVVSGVEETRMDGSRSNAITLRLLAKTAGEIPC